MHLSGETIGICVGGMAHSVSVGRLVGGLGRSGLFSVLLSDIVFSCLEVALRFSASKEKWKCFWFEITELIFNWERLICICLHFLFSTCFPLFQHKSALVS